MIQAHDCLQFAPSHRGTFMERPNRFLVRCDVPGRGVLDAFMPNPGRLWELLLPGAPVHLEELPPREGRKTRFVLLAVERNGAPVFLHTHATNSVAQHLLSHGLVPGLEQARIVRREVAVGRSRFDFLLEDDDGEILLEVKSCTLFGNGVAMFPDAVTERGRRHLLELAALARKGRRAAVMFVVHTPHVDWFMPDYHTDPAFADTLARVRRRVPILPMSVAWSDGLRLCDGARLLPVPWEHVARENRDRGGYMLVLRMARDTAVDVGGLGHSLFRAGYYLYVGSAAKNLTARVNRHLRRQKTFRWHIDYLRDAADECIAVPVRSSAPVEHSLAAALNEAFDAGPSGFGASDSPLGTHLFYSGAHPFHLPRFHEILQAFRMRRPGE